jgi:hypothetical protein
MMDGLQPIQSNATQSNSTWWLMVGGDRVDGYQR